MEALERSYEQGYRRIEIDFCWTSDDALVCVHDWSHYSIGHVPSEAEFEDIRTMNGYTSLTVSVLAEWMRAHPTVMIVTDIKERNVEGAKYLAEHCPDLLGRFVVQIYSREQYEEIRALGYSHIWLTLYQLPFAVKTDTALLRRYVDECDIEALVFSAELLQREGYAEALKTFGIPLYVHTVNAEEEQDAVRALGIYGIYTDTGDARARGK